MFFVFTLCLDGACTASDPRSTAALSCAGNLVTLDPAGSRRDYQEFGRIHRIHVVPLFTNSTGTDCQIQHYMPHFGRWEIKHGPRLKMQLLNLEVWAATRR